MGRLTVHRKGYHRRDGTYVRPAVFTVKDRGHPGRTPASKRWFPKGGKHRLAYDGKEWHADLGGAERRRILSHLARSEGWTPVERRLLALMNVTTSRKLKRAAASDIEWIKRKREA